VPSGDRLEALYIIAVQKGPRRCEILDLKWTDVDFDAGTLSAQRSLDKNGTFDPPKRKNSRRKVKLTARAGGSPQSPPSPAERGTAAARPPLGRSGPSVPQPCRKADERRQSLPPGLQALLVRAEISSFIFYCLTAHVRDAVALEER